MDCKRALEETGGDLEAAVRLLREKGIAQAAKRSGRETTEGKVAIELGEAAAAMVAVGCETEPVSNNDEFLAFVRARPRRRRAPREEAVAELEAERVELACEARREHRRRGAVPLRSRRRRGARRLRASTREQDRRARPRARQPGRRPPAGDAHLVRSPALPRAGRRAGGRGQAPSERFSSKQPDVASKPEEVRGKIVEGRIQKWLADRVLADQEWIHESGRKVGQALQEAGFEVIEFRRFALAE